MAQRKPTTPFPSRDDLAKWIKATRDLTHSLEDAGPVEGQETYYQRPNRSRRTVLSPGEQIPPRRDGCFERPSRTQAAAEVPRRPRGAVKRAAQPS
jgi:hypothetical protein